MAPNIKHLQRPKDRHPETTKLINLNFPSQDVNSEDLCNPKQLDFRRSPISSPSIQSVWQPAWIRLTYRNIY